METIEFTTTGRHTTTTGEACVVNDYKEGLGLASEIFGEPFFTNKIAVAGNFAIYENYVDSGSDQYCYFAIQLNSI